MRRDRPLVLSLFPGIGLLDRAFEEDGFAVVRGPDLLWGGDIRAFHVPSGRFEGIIGGPPCQAFSRMRYVNPLCGQKHGNLIPEFERVVLEAMPNWFVMENVPEAPEPIVPGYDVCSHQIRDVWVGGVTNRMRRFSFGSPQFPDVATGAFQIETLALHAQDAEHSALAGGGGRAVPVALIQDGKGGHKVKRGAMKNPGYANANALQEHTRKQGLPADFLADAPFTIAGKVHAIGNGVPLPMGRAVARAVVKAMGYELGPLPEVPTMNRSR